MAGARARGAGRGDESAVVECIATAFADDPPFVWAMGRARAGRAAAAVVAAGLRTSFQGFTIVPGEDPEGQADAVAWWMDAGSDPDSVAAPISEALWLAPRMLRLGVRGALRLASVSQAMQRQHPHEPHRYLYFLGASVQGSGRGAVALQRGLDEADAAGLPCYLESSNPRNRPFYRRHGFVDAGPMRLPKGCPELMPMWRR